MFHSRGIVQSKTGVPVGTSCISNAMCAPISRNVSRTPFPVMLRQIGYILAASAKISSPMSSPMSCSRKRTCRSLVSRGLTLAFNSASRRERKGYHLANLVVSRRSGMPQFGVYYVVGYEPLYVTDTLITWPFELLQRQAGRAVSFVELLSADLRQIFSKLMRRPHGWTVLLGCWLRAWSLSRDSGHPPQSSTGKSPACHCLASAE